MNKIFDLPPISECAVRPGRTKAYIAGLIAVDMSMMALDLGAVTIGAAAVMYGGIVRSMFGSFEAFAQSFLPNELQ